MSFLRRLHCIHVHVDNESPPSFELCLLCSCRGKKFARGDAFIGYQKDTPAAVVFQASNFLRRLREEDDQNVIESKLEVLDRAGVLDENTSLNVFLDREAIDEQWKEAVRHNY